MLIKKVLIYLITFIIGISLVSNPTFCQPEIDQEIEQFNGFTGIMVQDLYSREVLLSYNQDRLFTPASLVKLFILLSGLEILGQEYCYPTDFYFSSAVPGEIKGNLFIKGSGDPTQSPEVIRQIANDLVKKYGIHKIDGDIILDNSQFLLIARLFLDISPNLRKVSSESSRMYFEILDELRVRYIQLF